MYIGNIAQNNYRMDYGSVGINGHRQKREKDEAMYNTNCLIYYHYGD